jgi:hypothetical protein
VLEAGPKREHFQWFSWHFGGHDRKKHDAGLCHYMPRNLGVHTERDPSKIVCSFAL